ncbi:MAG: hypothetical protein IT366_21345 [Candidatus Hydrogenedentes bacterium]|nr:hypothetical protein [Candidatus Hydrogenedentota bacterium]
MDKVWRGYGYWSDVTKSWHASQFGKLSENMEVIAILPAADHDALTQALADAQAENATLRAELVEAKQEADSAAQETRRMFQAIWSIAEQVRNSPTLRAEIEPVKAAFTLECPHCKQQTHPEGNCHGCMVCEHCDKQYLFNTITGEVKGF